MSQPHDPASPPKLPGTYKAFVARFPALGAAHDAVADAVNAAGPLDARTLALIKIGMSIGAGLESAVRSHTRKALDAGATDAELEQTCLLAMNTLGFPRTVAAWTWVRQAAEAHRGQ